MILKVADEAWIATALLHTEHPQAEDFSLRQIRDRAQREFHDNRPGLWYHIVSHCVASKPPKPAQYRMLHETGRGKRRLYRVGDPCHPDRKGKLHPDKGQLPAEYRALVDWYAENYSRATGAGKNSTDPAVLLKFVGAISAFDLQMMSSAISAGCERVDQNEW